MTTRSAHLLALSQLKLLYDNREAANIAGLLIEFVTGKTKSERLVDIDKSLDQPATDQLQRMLSELSTNRPVQYVLGEAWFAGMPFYVDERVLIPRPETEELVEWIVNENRMHAKTDLSVLDIGTGSGCISISLKKKLPRASVTAIDVSKDALSVADKNAHALQADISWQCIDFLDERSWHGLPLFDILVSNPPYIKKSEVETMAAHVVHFEPSIALFVPENNPLVFYHKINAFAKTHLHREGCIFLEINETMGPAAVALFTRNDCKVVLKKDLQGKERMLRVSFR